MNATVAALVAIGGIVLGSGGMAGLLRVRSANRNDDADALIKIHQAAKAAIENVESAANAAVIRARSDAAYAQTQVEAAHAEVRQMQTELLELHRQLSDLRGQMTADRQAWQQETARQIAERMQEIAELQATVRTQQLEIQKLLLDQLTAARSAAVTPEGILREAPS